ncbi:hypothetical protein [Kouleothrix sp.]|uniref:hypothetical protein n=1 Tax=Kouleothrix sp. TaxID=2779161 RepID=UPI003918B6DF
MITQPRASKWPGLASTAVLALLCAFGAAAFLYPFFLAGRALNEQSAHAADAPLIPSRCSGRRYWRCWWPT